MKKIINLFLCCIIALPAFVLTGCNNEETLVVPNVPVEKGKLSFVLPFGVKNAVTYASVPGSPAEYEIRDLRIYWFLESDGSLHDIFDYSDGEIDLSETSLDASNNATVATIKVGNSTDASRFYIIANVNGTSPTLSATLDTVHVGTTFADDFEEILASNLRVTNGDIAAIVTPLPMSIRDAAPTGGGYITVPSPATAGVIANVHLKRRVARFDIINTAAWSNFEVTNVYISSAQRTVTLHDKPFTGAEPWANKTGSLVIDASAANGVAGAGADDGALSGSIANNGVDDYFDIAANLKDTATVNESVFYLYPTQLKQNSVAPPTTGTEITVEGKYYGSQPRMYKLNLTADVEIKANYVYRLKIVRTKEEQIQIALIVDEWDDVLQVPSTGVGSAVNWATATATLGATTIDLATATDADTIEYTSSKTAPMQLTVVTESAYKPVHLGEHTSHLVITQKAGTTFGTGGEYLDSDLATTIKESTVSSNTVLTYGGRYVTTHTLTLAPTDAPIATTLHIVNASNAQDQKTITLYSNNYAKLGYATVRVGNTLWAPLNVGASLTLLSPTDTLISSSSTNKANLEETDSLHFDYTGWLFQWGRNTTGIRNYPVTSSLPALQGPFTQAVADTLQAFITGGTNGWRTPELANAPWGGNDVQGPCPQGWRVPALADFNALKAAATFTSAANNMGFARYTINDKVLYFPCAGYRDGNNALTYAWGVPSGSGFYWTADATATTAYYWGGGTNLNNGSNTSSSRNFAMSVRAVRYLPAQP
jgi:hypothetical protein